MSYWDFMGAFFMSPFVQGLGFVLLLGVGITLFIGGILATVNCWVDMYDDRDYHWGMVLLGIVTLPVMWFLASLAFWGMASIAGSL